MDIADVIFDIHCYDKPQLRDVEASEHARGNTARLLSLLAFDQPELRAEVVTTLTSVLTEDCVWTTNTTRSHALLELVTLRAKESHAQVRAVFEKDLIDRMVYNGGYIGYLQTLGLRISKNDSLVKTEIDHPSVLVTNDISDHELAKISDRARRQTKALVKQHNKGISCASCGIGPRTGEAGAKPLYCPCKMVFYCDRTCQKAHWKQHKRICSTVKKKKN